MVDNAAAHTRTQLKISQQAGESIRTDIVRARQSPLTNHTPRTVHKQKANRHTSERASWLAHSHTRSQSHAMTEGKVRDTHANRPFSGALQYAHSEEYSRCGCGGEGGARACTHTGWVTSRRLCSPHAPSPPGSGRSPRAHLQLPFAVHLPGPETPRRRRPPPRQTPRPVITHTHTHPQISSAAGTTHARPRRCVLVSLAA